MEQKQGWGFDKNLIHSYVRFLLEYESTNGLLTSCKKYMFEKNLVLVELSLGAETLQTSWGMKLNFCM